MSAYDELDDEALLDAWRGGDGRAGSVLMGRYYRAIVKFFRARHRDWEELTQQTFLACIGAIERFRGDGAFGTFIFAVARRQLYRSIRDQASRDRRLAGWSEADLERSDTSPETAEPEDGLARQLLATLRKLPDETQAMLQSFYWGGMSLRDIAARFGLPEGTIKARIHRAREQIIAQVTGVAGSQKDFENVRRVLEKWADDLVRRRGGHPDAR